MKNPLRLGNFYAPEGCVKMNQKPWFFHAAFSSCFL